LLDVIKSSRACRGGFELRIQNEENNIQLLVDTKKQSKIRYSTFEIQT